MELKEKLMLEQKRYKSIIATTKKQLEHVPEGTLRIGHSHGCVQYYHRLPKGTHTGKYLSKKEETFAKKLAQKTYDERVLRHAQKRLSQIDRMLKDYENDEVEKWFLCEHPDRQKLIIPVEPTYQQQVDLWKSTPYVGKGFKEDSPVILTNSGLRVRSKSEKILADYFDSENIAYKYEYPLYLAPYGTIYPDFTFLSRKTGKQIYWEHEGMMDHPDYAKAAVKKIELYETNGIYPGEQLILTFESSISTINTKIIKELTHKYLL